MVYYPISRCFCFLFSFGCHYHPPFILATIAHLSSKCLTSTLTDKACDFRLSRQCKPTPSPTMYHPDSKHQLLPTRFGYRSCLGHLCRHLCRLHLLCGYPSFPISSKWGMFGIFMILLSLPMFLSSAWWTLINVVVAMFQVSLLIALSTTLAEPVELFLYECWLKGFFSKLRSQLPYLVFGLGAFV